MKDEDIIYRIDPVEQNAVDFWENGEYWLGYSCQFFEDFSIRWWWFSYIQLTRYYKKIDFFPCMLYIHTLQYWILRKLSVGRDRRAVSSAVQYSEQLWPRISRKHNSANRVENLSPAMGRGIDSRNRIWNWVAKLHRLGGPVRQPYAYLVSSPHSGTKVTDTDIF